jgi:putative tryptophan/tyrosine transport system substrate-binding protein
MNNRRRIIFALGAAALASPLTPHAQPQGKIWRIGFLGDGSAATRADQSLDPFREGMAELGYVVGRNLVLETRWTDSDAERRAKLIDELVRMPVDVLVTHGVQAGLAAKAATKSIPIVIAVAADLVGPGLIASLAHPGGNITGMTDQVADLAGKQVQLLKETLPRMKLVAIIRDSNNPTAVRATEDMQFAADKLGLRVLPITIRNAKEIDAAFATAVKQKADALITTHTPLTIMHRALIARLALERRLPMMSAPAPNISGAPQFLSTRF